MIEESDMPNRSTLKSLLAAFLITIVIAVAALLIALVLSTSGSSANGIGAYAGGISQKFVSTLMVSLPVIFVVVFFMFRRVFRKWTWLKFTARSNNSLNRSANSAAFIRQLGCLIH